MNKKLRQLLRDATISPTEDLIAECFKSSSEAYKAFIRVKRSTFYTDGVTIL